VFAESRIGVPSGWVRIRAALDDWGRNAYRWDDQDYTVEVSRIRCTVGFMQYFSSINAAADLYWCLDFGVNHWDINSAHPIIGADKYNRFALGTAIGFQTEHLFMELTGELYSMNNKGIGRNHMTGTVTGPNSPFPRGALIRSRPYPVEASLSILAGWKF
jgi:hypothetical protein